MKTRWAYGFQVLLDPNAGAGAGAGAGTGESGAGSAPAGDGTGAGTPAGGASAAGAGATGTASAAAGATGASSRFTYEEDRSRWVPPHRVREEAEARRTLERDLAIERQRVAALSGVQPASQPLSREDAALRDELYAKFPELKGLADNAQKLQQLLERLGNFDPQQVSTAQEHYFETMGVQTLNQLDTLFESEIGALTPFAQQMLHNNFGVWIQSDESGRLAQRYARQDPKLLTDFITEYRGAILDPHRRRITTAAQPTQERARRLPQQGGSSATIPGRPAALKPTNSDEYHNAAFASLNARGR